MTFSFTEINLPTLNLQGSVSNTNTSQATPQQEDTSVFDTAKAELTSWLNDTDKICEDGADDGKLSWKEKAEYFGKGLLGIAKTAIKHPIATGLTIAGGVALTALTGGAALPVMAAAGIAGGVITVGKGVYDAATAKTDAEAKQAFETMGNGTFAASAGILGAKSSLKTAGVDTDDMSTLQAVKGVFDYTKSAATELIGSGFGRGVLIDSNNTAHLVSNKTVTKQQYSVPPEKDWMDSISSDEAASFLKYFGEFADDIQLNPDNQYGFIDAHGVMQLFDETAKNNVIETFSSIKHPLQQVLKHNFNK